ncbi:hypothetical protein [Stakelama tenebrarum]|uniref:Uncharacterized protein n=1 Tax=Stakelama tenebrarum TaxID=2711215 RepID=A0A6G6Y3M8_9SPHN|nr:hypothetical protein [Sphingosinithalassobacter tenebrarum]QIG79532.1 hypothetical protein G5C33_06845 [Sphingosinithalassobacter tenebrarum]
MFTKNKLAVYAAVVLVVLAIAVFVLPMLFDDGRMKLKARRMYSENEYFAYVSPWGAESSSLFRSWGNHADTIHITPSAFPAQTGISWRWPPFAPSNGLSIWGYDHIGYGNYDGGHPEVRIPAKQVQDIELLSQTYAWTGSFSTGEATLLTEFYLRSDPEDNASKTLEIGWFLHVPKQTRKFLATGKRIGRYTDGQKRVWDVTLQDAFLTFAPPADSGDKNFGSIDMLAALHWLREKKVISGEEWFNGVAIGVEPLKGFGSVEIQSWEVEYR